MRAAELEHQELLELDPDNGVIRFAGQRALLFDAVAVGLLRQYLIANFGRTAARAVLTQFGFAHGWRMAEALETCFKWEDREEWRRAGGRLNALGGLFRVMPGGDDGLMLGSMTLASSFEAEQQILHSGRGHEPACWTICGITSGYLSHASGEEIFVLEDRCVGGGQAACRLTGRTRAAWGDQRADDLRYFAPIKLEECLDTSLKRVIETLKDAEKKLIAHRSALVRVVPELDEPLGVVSKSPAMRKVVDLARRVAVVDSTVLITGESGSGKERIARLVHDESARSNGPFIAVNCGAITESLLESELFGHARGAFTGATQDRPGLFEAASHGTLLLDEVGEVSLGMQVKLLRVLQEREVRRVGENKSRPIDVRVISATNRDLAVGVADGDFRQDLYYRLNVVELQLPALRNRREDVLVLARVLLARAALHMKREVTGLSPETADQLLRYSWPGNVRELENAMERAVALARGTRIELEDLPEEVRRSPSKPVAIPGAVRPLEEIAREYILATLELNGGNQTRTAEQLQIGTATLYRKLKAFSLDGTYDKDKHGSV